MLRKATFGKQAEFCRYVDITNAAWNNYEKGRDRIGLDTAVRLHETLGVSLDWVYLGNEGGMPYGLMEKIKRVEAEEKEQPPTASVDFTGS
jgi:transcriptional regulator with XRE-family HTH domain